MRHAIAEDRDLFAQTGLPDEERPLTEDGVSRLKKIVSRLKKMNLAFDVICQSPLVRSQQTAQIVADTFKNSDLITLEHLRPSSSLKDLIQDLNQLKAQHILIVGHEDHLSKLTSFLITRSAEQPFVYYKKAGISSLSFDKKIIPGHLQLDWLLTPKMMLGL